MSRIVLIAAVARNGIIGSANGLPWHLPEDLKRFRKLTLGHPMIMGRLTYESIGRALPGRTTIVLSRDPDFQPEDVVVARDPDEAIDRARDAHGPSTDIYVAGGEQIYRLFLPLADRMELTLVDAEPDGDAVFPAWDHDTWRPTSFERVAGDSAAEVPALDFVTLQRTSIAAGVAG